MILLHGFLGSVSDWDEVRAHLEMPAVAWPLPFSIDEFYEKTSAMAPFCLVGYSMGGRFALQFAAKYPDRVEKLVLVSTHLGLQAEEKKRARLAKDEALAAALLDNPDEFVHAWYEMPLFAPLKQRRDIVEMRKEIDAPYFATLLRSMSLGKQPCFVGNLPRGTTCIIGELDESYRALYRGVPHEVIPHAGHAIHLEEPKRLAHAISIAVRRGSLLEAHRL